MTINNTTSLLIKELFTIKWLEIKRSPFFRKKIVSIIFNSIVFINFIFFSFFGGIYINHILTRLYPNKSPYSVVSIYLPLIIVISALLRIFILKIMNWDIKPFLHWPVSKKRLSFIFLFFSFFNKYTLPVLLFIISYTIEWIQETHSFQTAIFFCLVQIYILIFSELFSLTVVKSSQFRISIFIFFLLNISLSYLITYHYLYAAGWLTPIFSVINIYYIITNHNDYYLLFENRKYPKSTYRKFIYLSFYNEINVKRITRNSILIKMMVIYAICMIAGLVTILNHVNQSEDPFRLTLMLIFFSGHLTFLLTVGHLFNWDYNWRDFIFAKPFSLYKYVKSNVLFAIILCLIPSFIYLIAYIVYSLPIFIYLSSFCLYIIIINYILAFSSIKNYHFVNPNYISPSTSDFRPGRLFFFIFFIIAGYIIYLFDGSVIIISHMNLLPSLFFGVIGIVMLLSAPVWFRIILRYLKQNKYNMFSR